MNNVTHLSCTAVALAMAFGFLPAGPAGGRPPGPYASGQGRSESTAAVQGGLPLRFEENIGQTDESVRWIARSPGMTLFLTGTDAVFALAEPHVLPRTKTIPNIAQPSPEPVEGRVIRMRAVGVYSTAEPSPGERLPGVTNYFLGDDPSRWRTGARSFASVRYRGVYDGVDLVYYGSGGAIEYDFEVAPGADPSEIVLAFDGAESVEVTEDGTLVLRAGPCELRQAVPKIYQPSETGPARVEGGFAVDVDGLVRFEVGAFDSALPLVIDPVVAYSTYLGGNAGDSVLDVKVDGWGNVYLAGNTTSADFPRLHAPWTYQGARDAFVTVLGRAGAALVYSTHIGGGADEFALALGLGPDGAVYIAGETNSANYPTVNAIETDAGNAGADVFVSKIDPTGASLVYSTYLGGNGEEIAAALAVDGGGGVYVVGETDSNDYPTTVGALQRTRGGDSDAFATRIGPSGTTLVYSTYVGGDGYDSASGVDVTSSGEAVLAGLAGSADFPLESPLQDTLAPGSFHGFALKLSPAGTSLRYSTYLGGDLDDYATDVALATDGAAVVVGWTIGPTFPTHDAIYGTAGGNIDGFALELAPDGDALRFSTFLPGDQDDEPRGVAIGPDGRIYVAGDTNSGNYPTVNALYADPDPGLEGYDAFATCLSSTGRSVVYSTYLGGTEGEFCNSLAVDGSGGAYVVGSTPSANFPTVGPYQAHLRGVSDGFVAKIANATANLQASLTASPEPVLTGQNLAYTFTVGNLGPNAAGDVIAAIGVPAGTSFVSANTSQGTFTLPAGSRIGYFFAGRIGNGMAGTLTLTVQVTASAGETIENVAIVQTTAVDPAAANNTVSVSSHVISGAPPPVIESVTSLIVTGKPYRIRITGTNFQEGIEVFIGSDAAPWPTVKRKNETRLVLKGGGTLKERFPAGVAVAIRVVNPDTGEDTTTFIR